MMEADLLRAALGTGAREAEVFRKRGRGRRVVLQQAPLAGRSSIVEVTAWSETGAALRLIDREGRPGFAWRAFGSPEDDHAARELLAAALDSARRGSGSWEQSPMARRGGRPPATPRDGAPSAPPAAAAVSIEDPEALALADERVVALLREAAAEIESQAGEAVRVERLSIDEAATSNLLLNGYGFEGEYGRTLVHLGLSLVPWVEGASAVVEERLVCRLADLPLQQAARDALARALPPRPAAVPAPDGPASGSTAPTGPAAMAPRRPPALVLEPRAAASLLAALAGPILAGEIGPIRRSALVLVDDATAPWRPGSVPFDGGGHPAERVALFQNGRLVGRVVHLGRSSYRDLPVRGPAGLRLDPCRLESASDDKDEGRDPEIVLRASVVEVNPGRDWRIRIRRGDWRRGGESLGPADGLAWEGTPEAIVAGVAEAGEDVGYYQCGFPIGAPTLRICGLGPWSADL
jgi:predicted Zn-dependent protease